jgi:hypothetical protein
MHARRVDVRCPRRQSAKTGGGSQGEAVGWATLPALAERPDRRREMA